MEKFMNIFDDICYQKNILYVGVDKNYQTNKNADVSEEDKKMFNSIINTLGDSYKFGFVFKVDMITEIPDIVEILDKAVSKSSDTILTVHMWKI